MLGLTRKFMAFFIIISLPIISNAEQICLTTSIASSTKSNRFLNNQDGTITDKKTGLMWKACSEGQVWNGSTCANTAKTYNTWQEALQTTQSINNAGGYAKYSDWRLPNVKELTSIVERQCYFPAINLDIFRNTPEGYYWTSSPASDPWSDDLAGNIWRVNFYHGQYYSSSSSTPEYDSPPFLRLVRNN